MRNEFENHSSAEVSFLVGSLPPESWSAFLPQWNVGGRPECQSFFHVTCWVTQSKSLNFSDAHHPRSLLLASRDTVRVNIIL